MEVGCKTNHPYYGSPLLIYINLPRAFAKRRRPSVEAKGGSAILQIVSAAKWRVSGFLFWSQYETSSRASTTSSRGTASR